MHARLCPRLAPAARRVCGGLKDTQMTHGQYDSIESGPSMHTHLGLARRARRIIPRVLGATPLGCCGRGARACCQGTGALSETELLNRQQLLPSPGSAKSRYMPAPWHAREASSIHFAQQWCESPTAPPPAQQNSTSGIRLTQVSHTVL